MNDIHTEAHAIIEKQPEAVHDMLNDLRNYLYAATGPIERNEYKDTTQEAIMEPIQASLDFAGAASASTFAGFMRAQFKKAGFDDKVETIRSVAVETISSIVAEHVQNGRVRGSAHHIRQEAAAKALVAVSKKLGLA